MCFNLEIYLLNLIQNLQSIELEAPIIKFKKTKQTKKFDFLLKIINKTKLNQIKLFLQKLKKS